jgi:hypothetical protein
LMAPSKDPVDFLSDKIGKFWFSVTATPAAVAVLVRLSMFNFVLMSVAGVEFDESGLEDLLEIIRRVFHAVDESFILFPGAGLGGETDFKSFCKRLEGHVASHPDIFNFAVAWEKQLQVIPVRRCNNNSATIRLKARDFSTITMLSPDDLGFIALGDPLVTVLGIPGHHGTGDDTAGRKCERFLERLPLGGGDEEITGPAGA